MSALMEVRRAAAFAFVAIASAGCQTPSAVYDLAEKTSSSAAVFQNHLAEVAAQSKSLAQERADHVVSMDAFNAQLDAVLKRELYMQQHANSAADWKEIKSRMEELTALRDELIKIEQSATILENERRKEILAKQTDLNTYKTALRDLANALNALARKESKSERAQFIGKYLREVSDDLNESLKKSDKTSQAAKALVDDLKAKLKGAEPEDAGNSSK